MQSASRTKRRLKHACEILGEIPRSAAFPSKLLEVEEQLSVSGSSAKIRTLKRDSLEFKRDWTYQPGKCLLFALLDLWDTPGLSVPEDHVKHLHFSFLLATLCSMKAPSISMLVMWLWIVNLANELAQAIEYARESFTNYSIQESKYIPAKNERLYDRTTRKQSLDVFLLFLMKKGDREAKSLWGKILSKYCAPNIPYYLEAGKYLELKYRLSSSELCMEFYLDLLYDFCKPEDQLFGIYTRLKCLVATKVKWFLFVIGLVVCIQFNVGTCYPWFKDIYGSIVLYFVILKYYR